MYGRVNAFVFLCHFLQASVGGDSSSEAPSSSGVSSLGTSDIITEQPRSSQHALQPGDSVDLSASEQGVGPDTPDEEDEENMLSRSSSGGTGVVSTSGDLVTEGNQMLAGAVSSSPPSDSSQTTTEGPDSAVTPSDCAELVSVTSTSRRYRTYSPPSPTPTEGPDLHSDSESSLYRPSSSSSSTSTSSSTFSAISSSSSSDQVSRGWGGEAIVALPAPIEPRPSFAPPPTCTASFLRCSNAFYFPDSGPVIKNLVPTTLMLISDQF